MSVDPNGNAWWHWLLGIFAIAVLAAVVVTSAVMTGGASLISIGSGFFVGAGVNIVGQGINNISNGKGFFEDINVVSILLGGLSGAAMMTGIGGALGAFTFGALENVANSSIEKRDFSKIIKSSVLSGTFSMLGFGVGNRIANIFSSLTPGSALLKGLTLTGVQKSFKELMSNYSAFIANHFCEKFFNRALG